MKTPLYRLFRYGPLGAVDVLYVKIHKGHNVTWIRDKDKASVFKYTRAIAMQRGRRSAGGDDLVLDPVHGAEAEHDVKKARGDWADYD